MWIEAALNGPWGRERQPGIPVTVDEIIADGVAATQAGAAIVHLHAYDEATGRQRDDWQLHARIIEGIRAKSDVIVYPTIPSASALRTRRGAASLVTHAGSSRPCAWFGKPGTNRRRPPRSGPRYVRWQVPRRRIDADRLWRDGADRNEASS